MFLTTTTIVKLYIYFPIFLSCFSKPFTMVIVFCDPRLRVGSAGEHRAGEPKVECSIPARGTGEIRFLFCFVFCQNKNYDVLTTIHVSCVQAYIKRWRTYIRSLYSMSEYGELWKTQTYRLILPNEFYGSCGLKKPICKRSHFLDDKTLEKTEAKHCQWLELLSKSPSVWSWNWSF